MCNVIEIADSAEMIINGYAFTKEHSYIRVLNLNKPKKLVSLAIKLPIGGIQWFNGIIV